MNKPIVIATSFVIIIIIAYVIAFYGSSVSDKTSDWGAFGSYLDMGVGILSVALIYVTYKEQRQANRIGMFEQQMRFMFDKLSILLSNYSNGIEEEVKKIEKHFLSSFGGMEDYERAKVKYVCSYYFSQLTLDIIKKYDNVFIYLSTMINYIRNEKSINNDCVKSRMIELSCILSEYVRLYYFFWLTSQRNDSGLLRICYMNNLFTKEDPNSFLSAVMCYVCTEKKLEITDVDIC